MPHDHHDSDVFSCHGLHTHSNLTLSVNSLTAIKIQISIIASSIVAVYVVLQ